MRPDVALAFDRMEAAARADGVALSITSALRSNAEQAVLFARHPDPKWVAPPGKSLHRLGHRARPRSARGLRVAGGERDALRLHAALLVGALALRVRPQRRDVVGRLRRRRTATASVGAAVVRARAVRAGDLAGRAALERVGALLAAQLYAGVGLQPVRALAGRVRRGSRSSCRGPRRPTGCATRSTPSGRSTPRRTSCATCCASSGRCRSRWRPTTRAPARSPPAAASRRYPETRGYVARILGLLGGAGDIGLTDAGLAVRLVR